MPKRISVTKHLTIEQREQHYRQATDGVESRQYQIIWLLAQGKKTEEVEEITGYSRTWIYALLKRHNEFGAEGLGDLPFAAALRYRRYQNQGTKPLIDDVEQAQLWQALQEKAPDGGLWNGRKVADWPTCLTGRQVSRQKGWEILGQMTFRLPVPRPSHTESDYFEQEAWEKN